MNSDQLLINVLVWKIFREKNQDIQYLGGYYQREFREEFRWQIEFSWVLLKLLFCFYVLFMVCVLLACGWHIEVHHRNRLGHFVILLILIHLFNNICYFPCALCAEYYDDQNTNIGKNRYWFCPLELWIWHQITTKII